LINLEFTLECSQEWHSPEWAGTEFQWNSIQIWFVYLLLIVYLFVQRMLIWQQNMATLFFPPPTMLITTPAQLPPTSVTHAHDYTARKMWQRHVTK
jgi:hypothetical protein